MSELYKKLKPFHIQQDRSDGCSLCSFLVIRNAIAKPKMRQKGMRSLLEKMHHPWLSRVSGRRRGVFVKVLKRYIEDFLDEHLPEYEVNIHYSRSFSCREFMLFIDEVNTQVREQFIIFNYDGHYSPLGRVDFEKDQLSILDVDWVEKYDKEFTYKMSRGEYKVSIESFLKKLKSQRRYFLTIERK